MPYVASCVDRRMGVNSNSQWRTPLFSNFLNLLLTKANLTFLLIVSCPDISPASQLPLMQQAFSGITENVISYYTFKTIILNFKTFGFSIWVWVLCLENREELYFEATAMLVARLPIEGRGSKLRCRQNIIFPPKYQNIELLRFC